MPNLIYTYEEDAVSVVLLGIRPNKKYKLFSLKDKKGVTFHGQCIVGFVGTGRTETCETEKD